MKPDPKAARSKQAKRAAPKARRSAGGLAPPMPDRELAVEEHAAIVDRVIDECEHAMLEVEARCDEPGQRVPDGALDTDDEATQLLRMAVAELVDRGVGLAADLDHVCDRARALGPRAAARALFERPLVMDLARLAIELSMRTGRGPQQEALREMQTSLRARLS